MTRSYLHSSLALLVTFVAACGNAGTASDAPGEPGVADPTAQAEPSADKDDDGLPADQDLCPGTASGAKVDGNGCSTEQRAAQTSNADTGNGSTDEPGKQTPRDPVEQAAQGNDGLVAPNGFAVFVLDPSGTVPVTLRTLASNVTNLASGGFALSGTVTIDVPGDQHVTLAEAKLELDYDAKKGQGLQRVQGMARLPFPDLGFMDGVSMSDVAYASVGYDLGENLKDVNAPLKADRKYVFFAFSSGLEAQIGQMTVSTANNQSVTMTLDPSDPSFFLRASLGGLMGPIDEASVGFSIGGHLPFTAENTWGINAQAASFDGHLWIGGKVNLNDVKLPIAIGGNTVVDLDANDDGKSVFVDAAGGFQFGSNSELDVSVSAGLLSFEVPIAQSTLIGRISSKAGSADYSGVVTAGNGWMPDAVPLKNTTQLKAAGHASTSLDDTYFMAEGDVSLDAGKLGQWTGLKLSDLAMAQASLSADKNGLIVTGTASTSISPYIGLNGQVQTVGFFNGNPKDWYVTLDGRFAVSGIDLSADAHARVDREGLRVTGTFVTPLSDVAMSGQITSKGVDIEGTAEVTIPIVAGKEELQWVTDAAVCGYETVTDAAVCGSETVANGAVCGYDTVKDAALCGTTVVTEAGQCGVDTVTNGAVCGYHTVTDGAKCGWDVVSSCVSCVSVLWGGSCDCGQTARSCNVASTCNVPKTCSIAATCNIAKTCEVPQSCERVKSCQTKVTIPDFDYGSFKGIVNVKIGDSGLEGGVKGQYCPTGSSCTTLAGGRIKLSSGKPEACVDIVGVGEACAPF